MDERRGNEWTLSCQVQGGSRGRRRDGDDKKQRILQRGGCDDRYDAITAAVSPKEETILQGIKEAD